MHYHLTSFLLCLLMNFELSQNSRRQSNIMWYAPDANNWKLRTTITVRLHNVVIVIDGTAGIITSLLDYGPIVIGLVWLQTRDTAGDDIIIMTIAYHEACPECSYMIAWGECECGQSQRQQDDGEEQSKNGQEYKSSWCGITRCTDLSIHPTWLGIIAASSIASLIYARMRGYTCTTASRTRNIGI